VPDNAIYQAFTVGRIRVLMTDSRSARDPAGVTPRSMLGAEQKAWLVSELAAADRYAAVIWVNPDPWIGSPNAGSDGWGAFPEERTDIANAIANNRVHNLVLISGDAHMLALDDGTNSDYSTARDGGFPVLHAAPLDRKGGTKGGPYSGPVIEAGGQFATVTVNDNGTTASVTFTGRNWKGEQLFNSTFPFPPVGAA
jgi:phosphodiesterase/alkaline phosphatase D-like protein